jgi:starch phosphorylase
MYDVLVKRIHEYKRQHLKILHIVSLYHGLKSNPGLAIVPRTFIFGGKAAPGYHLAKLMIKLITSVGDVINRDPDMHDRLKLVFLPNFNVTNGQHVYPAADLSEQISTAGKEASGTGNMKFCMNGALTIGTLDGANIELREEIGAENFFLFGLSVEEVLALKSRGYRPMDYYAANPHLREVIDLIRSGFFTRGDTALLQPLMDNLLHHDPYMLFADFASYIECQEKVSAAYRDPERWTRMAILNTARSGMFSSDRSIREYCQDIWRVQPVPITLLSQEQSLTRAEYA